MDTANLIEMKHIKFHLNTQLSNLDKKTNDTLYSHNKLSINSHIDKRLSMNSGLRGTIGIGPTAFRIGGFYKWAPIPDLPNQPAVSLLTGIMYTSLDEDNDLSLRLHPIVSKNLTIKNIGQITPYGSLPIGIRSLSHKDIDIPIQLTLGAEFKRPKWKQVTFMTEMNFNVQNSSNYFGFGINVNFDEAKINLSRL